MSNISIARGSSGDFEQTHAEDIEDTAAKFTVPTTMVSDLVADLDLASVGMKPLILDPSQSSGKPVGMNIGFINMSANNSQATCDVYLVRRLRLEDATYRYAITLYGTLTATAGSNKIDTNRNVADTITISLAAEGTRIETKTGIASSAGAGANNGFALFNIPDLDNAYAVLLDAYCAGTPAATRVNTVHEFTT